MFNTENRLIAVVPTNPVDGDKKVEFVYDYIGRRVSKKISIRTSGTWSEVEERLFVYDGWNMVEEIMTKSEQETSKYYVHGLDLSQSWQGAGGIGGLLASVDTSSGNMYYYCYDVNGNVGQLVNGVNGEIEAHYQYDPFGNKIVTMGSMADENPFRFSTKYFDEETELYYYGFRYYSSYLGRWLNKDPIGDGGGVNLFKFINNNPISYIDFLGLRDLTQDEIAALTKLEQLQSNAAADPRYKDVAKNIGEFINDFRNRVSAIPKDHKDPTSIAIVSTSLKIWDQENAKFDITERDTRVAGLTPLKKDVWINCNYYVADVLQRSLGINLAKRSLMGKLYPPSANTYANPKYDIRLFDFSKVSSGDMGDVISFPDPEIGEAGHVGIYLGHDIYISSRIDTDAPGVLGENPIQPYSGVQVKQVPPALKEPHVIIRYIEGKKIEGDKEQFWFLFGYTINRFW